MRESGEMDPNQSMGDMNGMPGGVGASSGDASTGGADGATQQQPGADESDIPNEQIEEDFTTIHKVVGGRQFSVNPGLKRELNTRVQSALDHWAQNEFQKDDFQSLSKVEQYKGAVELIKAAIIIAWPQARSGSTSGTVGKIMGIQRDAERSIGAGASAGGSGPANMGAR